MTPEEIRELSMFGVRMDTGRPILERVKTNRCIECNGFGTYGNPLCGAVYRCVRCNATGYEPKKLNVWNRFLNWLRRP